MGQNVAAVTKTLF